MTPVLRITLVLVSIITVVFMIRKIRNSKIQLEDSIFWFCIAGILVIVSIFPGIFYALSDLVGTYSTVNFVFLFFIFALLIQSFNLSIKVSQANAKISELTQQLAIEKLERRNNDEANMSPDDEGPKA